MNNPNNAMSLVILAAGRGSRFGGPKQFTDFGPNQWPLMLYNISHAFKAGILHVVFITRPEHLAVLQEKVLAKLPSQMTYDVVYQDISNFPQECFVDTTREKPLGTAHALWCAKSVVKSNMLVVNADDYYGSEAFTLAAQQLNSNGLVAFELKNTLSMHGGVNRGQCKLENNKLIDIEEILDITQDNEHECIGYTTDNTQVNLPLTQLVSMNCWFFTQDIWPALETVLTQTLTENAALDVEAHLPSAAALLLTQNNLVKVLTSHDAWFGVTYAADSEAVNLQLTELTQQGKFPALAEQ